MELTKKQEKLLRFYKDKSNWRPPTLKQMRVYMEVKSDQSVIDFLKSLKKKGFI